MLSPRLGRLGIALVCGLVMLGAFPGTLLAGGEGENAIGDTFPLGIETGRTHPASNQSLPRLSWDGTNFLLAWVDGGTGSSSVRFQRISTQAAFLDPCGRNVPSEDGTQLAVDAAWNGSQCMVVWEARPTGFDTDIYAARVDSDGNVLDPNGIAICSVHRDQTSPRVTAYSSGFLVAWADKRYGEADIYAARVDPQGRVLDRDGFAVCTEAETQSSPVLSFDGDHTVLLAWQDKRSGYSWDLYGARVDSSGTVLDEEGMAISTAVNAQLYPEVAWGQDRFLVVWHDERNGIPPDYSADLYAATVSSDGVVHGGDTLAVIQDTTSVRSADLAWDSARGRHVLVWATEVGDASFGLRAAYVDQNGTLISGEPLPFTDADYTMSWPAIAVDDSSALVVWQQRRETSEDETVLDLRAAFLEVFSDTLKADSLVVPEEYAYSLTPIVSEQSHACVSAYSTEAEGFAGAWIGQSSGGDPLVYCSYAEDQPFDTVVEASITSGVYGLTGLATAGLDSVICIVYGQESSSRYYARGSFLYYEPSQSAWGLTTHRSLSRSERDTVEVDEPFVISTEGRFIGGWHRGAYPTTSDRRIGDKIELMPIYAKIDDGGDFRLVQGDEFIIQNDGDTESEIYDYVAPAAAAHGSLVLAAWQVLRADTSTVFAQLLELQLPDPPGTDAGELVALTDEFAVLLGPFPQAAPTVAWTGGYFLVAWSEERQSSEDIVGVLVDTTGQVVSTEAIVISADTYDEFWPSIATNSAGDLLAVWRYDHRFGTPSFMARRLLLDGSATDPAIAVATGVCDSCRPTVELTADGRIMSAFSSYERGGAWNNIAFTSISNLTYLSTSPPGFAVWVIQSTAFERSFDLVAMPSEILESSPVADVSVGTSVGIPVAMGRPNPAVYPTLYVSTHMILQSGIVSFDVTGWGITGRDTTVSGEFSAVTISEGNGVIASPDGGMSVTYRDGAFRNGMLISLMTAELAGMSSMPGVEPVAGGVYWCGPEDATPSHPVEVTLAFDPSGPGAEQPGRLSIYVWDGQQTEELGGTIDIDAGVIRAESSDLGLFWIGPRVSGGTGFARFYETRIEQNYPNPFNPLTTIQYSVGTDQGPRADVSLEVFNVLGQRVRTLVEGGKVPGVYQVVWDGTNDHGRKVTTGVYFYRLKVGNTGQTRKMLLVK